MKLFLELFGRQLTIGLTRPAVDEDAEHDNVAAVTEIAPATTVTGADWQDLGGPMTFDDSFGFGHG